MRTTNAARRICAVLISTRSAERQVAETDDLIVLNRVGGGRYFVYTSGRAVNQGPSLADSWPMGPNFLQAMAALGKRRSESASAAISGRRSGRRSGRGAAPHRQSKRAGLLSDDWSADEPCPARLRPQHLSQRRPLG